MYAVLPHVGVAELLWLGLGALLGTHARADTSVLFTKSSPLCLLHETPFLPFGTAPQRCANHATFVSILYVLSICLSLLSSFFSFSFFLLLLLLLSSKVLAWCC